MMETRGTKGDWFVFAALAAAALAPALSAGQGDFTFADASRHAMDGVFVLDAIKAHPLTHPFEWAREYYITSPALGFGRYPPLFAVFEVPFYAFLGATPLAGRFASVFLWLMGLLFFYETLRGAMGRWGAAFAALALAASPASVIWGREAMLELPATGIALMAVYSYVRHLDGAPRRYLTTAVALACLAGWTKQPAALVVVVIALHLLFVVRPPRLLSLVWPSLTVAAVLLPLLAALSLVFGRANVALMTGTGQTYPWSSPECWLCYIRQIPYYYLGWPLAVFALAGVAFAVFRRNASGATFWLVWIAVFYAFFTAVGYKTPRLIMFWTPALVYFAGLGLVQLAGLGTALRPSRVPAAVLLPLAAISIAWTYAYGWCAAPRAGAEMREVASKALAALPDRILYVGSENGTFIFRVRELAGPKRPVVIRDSKVFYSEMIQPELGRVDTVSTMAQVKEVTARVAPDVVVVERGVLAERALAPATRLFIEYVQSADFQPLDFVTAPAGHGRAAAVTFELYRYTGPRRAARVDIPLPGVGMRLQLPSGR